MRGRVVLAFDGSGNMSFLHDDTLLRALGQVPAAVTRLSSIEFGDDGHWTVVSELTGAVLYRNRHRDMCLDWERNNIQALLGERTEPVHVPGNV